MPEQAFTIRGIGKLRTMLKGNVMKKEVERKVRRATGRNGLLVLKAIRKRIQADKYAENAELTEAIKGSGKPLVDFGDLFQAMAMHQPDAKTVFVGILKTDDAFNIGVALHEGKVIKVTDKMRGLFFVLWLASVGGIDPAELKGRAQELFRRYKHWKPLDEETTEIRIPARRFIGEAFEAGGLKRKIVVNWKNAVREGMIDASRKGK